MPPTMEEEELEELKGWRLAVVCVCVYICLFFLYSPVTLNQFLLLTPVDRSFDK